MNKTILITGARKGIGRFLVEYYSERSFNVIGISRTESDFNAENYEHHCLDIVDESSVKKLFSSIRKKYTNLDILINNAGVNSAISPVLLIPLDSARKTLETNILGTFLMSREAIKLMMKKSYGRIINLSSMAVKHEVQGESIYTASKVAINSFSRVLAKEVASYGITCNVVAPSAIPTDMTEAINQKALLEVLQRNAIHEYGKMEDVTNTIDWLIKPESHSITGQIIYLGGV